jgi:nucleoid DNA-binding protein
MENGLPADVAGHLQELVASSKEDWAKNSDALPRLKELWLEKNRLFEEQMKLLGFTFIDTAEAGDSRGMILTTYSGSLVALGPGSSRRFEYASIKMRSDVPDIIRGEGVQVDDVLRVGGKASFTGSPVKHTSAVYRIAAAPGNLGVDDQEQRIREAMVFLTNSFVHLNRHFTYPGSDGPGQFDKKSMIRYLAENNGLTQKAVRNLIDDYAILLETGMLMGNVVPIGQIGRLTMSLKPARKARIGRNPATGEELTVPAKDAHMAPAFKFSSRAKERTGNLPVSSKEDKEG